VTDSPEQGARASARSGFRARSSTRTRSVVTAGLVAALLAAASLIAIPLPFSPVPVTLQTFVVIVVALTLSPGIAAAGIGGYLVLGAVGVPVFSGGHGGLAWLAGPTGGFLVGFLVAGSLGSALRLALASRAAPAAADALAAALALALVYLCGWPWLAFVAHMSLGEALLVGVVPFVPADALKAVGAVAVAAALRRAGVGVRA
jgi:biotin transport system substrate-specific component